jgi:hypothetical protein
MPEITTDSEAVYTTTQTITKPGMTDKTGVTA